MKEKLMVKYRVVLVFFIALFVMAVMALPVSSAKEVTFVHMTDVHLCETEFAEGYYDTSPGTDPLAFFNETIDEIKSLNPDFVVDTGDLVAAADKFGPEIAERWFQLYNKAIPRLVDAGIDVHVVLGNHDVIGVNDKSVNNTEPGYGKEMFRTYFGTTNYSFDEGGYQLVIVKNSTVTSKDYGGFTIQDDSGEVYVYGGYAGYDTSAVNVGDKVDVIWIGWQYKDMYEVCLRTASDVSERSIIADTNTRFKQEIVDENLIDHPQQI